jgi:hypothetical protein
MPVMAWKDEAWVEEPDLTAGGVPVTVEGQPGVGVRLEGAIRITETGVAGAKGDWLVRLGDGLHAVVSADGVPGTPGDSDGAAAPIAHSLPVQLRSEEVESHAVAPEAPPNPALPVAEEVESHAVASEAPPNPALPVAEEVESHAVAEPGPQPVGPPHELVQSTHSEAAAHNGSAAQDSVGAADSDALVAKLDEVARVVADIRASVIASRGSR